ncbi:TRAP transporter small permease [Thalassospira sp.]|uniref:TRAP transporter small permease n=1 Tax=Thalassospira sp. TaxID=1912094 RepID=UPI003AA860D9
MSILNFVYRVSNVLKCVEKFLIGIMAILAIILIMGETVLRYLAPAYLPDWGAEVTVYLVGWATMLSLPSLVTQDKHVRADLVVDMFSRRMRKVLEILVLLVGIVFCAIILKAGIEVVQFGLRFGEISDSSLSFPMWIFYLAVPFGYGFSLLRYVMLLITRLTESRTSSVTVD